MKRFRKAPVIERIVLLKIHLVLLIVRKQQELTREFQDNRALENCIDHDFLKR